MGLLLILGVCVAFMVAILTAGYNDNPNRN